MIEKIDIKNFGSYKEFLWDENVIENGGAVAKFKKLNIIFGRNYSGKTTLSRIFRSFEVGSAPARYDNPSFRIKTKNGTLSSEQINNQEIQFRVYNKDFVEKNLKFLIDESENIESFAVLGAENQQVENDINEVLEKLGSADSGTGLRGEYSNKNKILVNENKILTEKQDTLKKKLVDKANSKTNGIKYNWIYKNPNYDVRELTKDIEKVREDCVQPMSDSARLSKIATLEEKALKNISFNLKFNPSIEGIWSKTKAIVNKKITPSAPLQDLLSSAVLEKWVGDGMKLHKDAENCAFCRQKLPINLWVKLGNHFNQESEDLKSNIQNVINIIDSEKKIFSKLNIPKKEDFYLSFHDDYSELMKRVEELSFDYDNNLEKMKELLVERSNNIFQDKQVEDFDLRSASEIESALKELEQLIIKSEAYTEKLDARNELIREELRLSEVANFISDINLSSLNDEIEAQENKIKEISAELKNIKKQGQELNEKLSALQAQLRDERRGAAQVNVYLSHPLGGTNLRLIAEENEQSIYKFKIMRGDEPAYNLSEGECSLVSFCYFLARLNDVQTKDIKPIIYIDDPISSLDNNHIFFIFSLIDSYIAKPVCDEKGNDLKDNSGENIFRYGQLFISTHNLDFLKYLRRLTKPKEVQSLIISRKNIGSSIGVMPKYLKDYVTELNYLFGEIYNCVDDSKCVVNYQSFYSFGNNLRKFLEALLFFKYPSSTVKSDAKIKLFFGETEAAESLIKRITNEYSHLEEFVDRGAIPIDNAEISKIALFVFDVMKKNDPSQYEHFLSSIGVQDPLKNENLNY